MKNLLSLTVAIILLVVFTESAVAQANSTPGEKVWYSVYLHKKINSRWSVDNLSLLGMSSFKHDFWFFQNNLGATYKINRLLSISGGYGHSLYKYSPWWVRHYPQKPNFLNTVSFHSIFFSIQRKTDISSLFSLSNELTMQYFIPKFEKYQTRFHYNIRLSYKKRDLPIGLKPFVEGSIYYYINGVKTNYYDQNYNIVSMGSPNGLHRFRGKVGLNFVPITSTQKFSITLYYGINREFNIRGLGNQVNINHPSASGKRIVTTYPFNNYDIVALQLNYLFK